MTILQKYISSSCFFRNFYLLILVRYDFNMRCCFWELLNLLFIACIEQDNNFNDDFAEYIRTFLMSDFQISI